MFEKFKERLRKVEVAQFRYKKAAKVMRMFHNSHSVKAQAAIKMSIYLKEYNKHKYWFMSELK